MKRVFLGMAATLLFIASLALAPEESGATPEDVIRDETEAGRVKQQFLALTDGWTREVVFKKSETEAMARGRAWEDLMMTGLDDPLARKILAAGEPSYNALA